MAMARLVVTAVLEEGRSKSEVARDYGVSRRWVITLVQRFLAEGEAGLVPRSRRPRRSPNRTPGDLEDEIVAIRKELDQAGHEAGAATIAFHLERRHGRTPAVSTIWRILTARGFVTPQPHKRPKSSYVRFEAEQPNERWQIDITHWPLADGTDIEILNVIDDHSRLCVASTARPRLKAADVVDSSTPPPPATPPASCPTTVPSSPAATAARPGRARHPQPPRHRLQPLPALPPPDLRESRTLPPDREGWLATRPPAPTIPACNPARRLRRLLQHRPSPPSPRATHPQDAYDSRPKALPTGSPSTTTATASATTRSTATETHPPPQQPAPSHRHRPPPRTPTRTHPHQGPTRPDHHDDGEPLRDFTSTPPRLPTAAKP